MRFNTSIDFLQPSGGNVLDVHHIEFKPAIPISSCTPPLVAEIWSATPNTSADDNTLQSTITSCVSNGSLNGYCGTIQDTVGSDTVCRIEFSGLSKLRPGDAIGIHSAGGDFDWFAVNIIPYTGSISVDNTYLIRLRNFIGQLENKTDRWFYLYLTYDFINALADQGDDTFAVRFFITTTGTFNITEIQGCFSYLDETGFALPSGSLWYRPTDGQNERLAYKGASGVYEVRDVDGIGYYEFVTATDMTPGPFVITWEEALIRDEGYTFLSSDSQSVILGLDGLYKLTYCTRFSNNTAGGNSDASVLSRLIHNGSGIAGSTMTTYIPTIADGREGRINNSVMCWATAGDRIQLEVDFYNSSLSAVDVFGSYLEVEFIRKWGIRHHEDYLI